MKKVFFTLLMLTCALVVGADPVDTEEPHPIDIKFDHCLSLEEGMTTVGMQQCALEATQAWDDELNHVYKVLMSKLEGEAKEKLKRSQRAWVAYKALEIENIDSLYRYSFESGQGGSLLIPMRAMDKMAITKNRTLELTGYLSIIN